MINNKLKSTIKYYCNELYNDRQVELSKGFLFGISQVYFISSNEYLIAIADMLYRFILAYMQSNLQMQSLIDINELLDKE